MSTPTPLGAIGRGLIAGAVGTTAMDALLFSRYRGGGGAMSFRVANDLSAHLVYGLATASVVRLLSR